MRMGSIGRIWTYYTSKCWKSRAGRSRSIKKMGVARKFKVGPNWEVLYYYCSECTCYLNEVCDNEFHPLVGNGFCNDETNNFKCNFDGGDCCGLCILKDHCTNCFCIENVTVNQFFNALIGNGYCNDRTNNLECNYDGGDCCLSYVNTKVLL